MDTGDAAWVLTSSALVLFMTPGLALFYGGMDRTRNVLNMLMMNFWCLLVIPIAWVVVGYSLAQSGDGAFLGNLDMAFLRGFGITGEDGGSGLLTVAFLGMFAVITPALISGAVADRIKFSAWAIFAPAWLLLVFSPVFKWVYGGWIGQRGALDFAGGTAIHVNAGIAALAAVLVLGKRKGWPGQGHPPHSMPLVMLGTGILWFGWFGFNAGSALAANGVAVQAFMNTFLAAAAAGLSWGFVEKFRDGHFTNLGVASGIVAGLVAITPGAGFVAGMSPIWIGLATGVICCFAVGLKTKAGYDDALDVVGSPLRRRARRLAGHRSLRRPGVLRRRVHGRCVLRRWVRAPRCAGPGQCGHDGLQLRGDGSDHAGSEGHDRCSCPRSIEDSGLDLAEHAETAYSSGSATMAGH